MSLRAVFVVVLCASAIVIGSCSAPPPAASATDFAVPASAPAVPVPSASAADPSLPAPAPPVPGAGSCPAEMVLVEGDYCPKVEQTCLRWLDPPTSPYRQFRCAEYAEPARCLAPRETKRFCIDREEWTPAGDALPLVHQSFTSATNVCRGRGARLCLESEWQFACEGERMQPYPYGRGFVRDAGACNVDRMDLGRPQAGLRDLRAPASAYPTCVSPFGVHDMSGNVEEWAQQDHGRLPDRGAMKGAWWLPGKNTCRAVTLGHGEIYEGPQVGVRCCRDAS